MSTESESTPCTWLDDAICVDCNLGDELNCRHDEKSVGCFLRRHLTFRIIAFLVVGASSWLTSQWILLLIYAVVTLLNFTVIESWYLCRHCPFYAKEGRTLTCITLQGMPRIWSYDSRPITRGEQIAMSVVGGFIDLFPLLAGAYAIWVLYSTGAEMLLLGMLGLTVIMLGASVYFGKYLADEYCIRCVNFSCVMNKVPKHLAGEYLRRNPLMRKAWEDWGYALGED